MRRAIMAACYRNEKSAFLIVLLIITASCERGSISNRSADDRAGRNTNFNNASLPASNEISHWKDAWDKGNQKQQEEALEWVYRKYVIAGMEKKDVERFLGPGIRAVGTGEIYGFLPRDEHSKYMLWIHYKKVRVGEVVHKARLIIDRTITDADTHGSRKMDQNCFPSEE
jgi:hypothetical protein